MDLDDAAVAELLGGWVTRLFARGVRSPLVGDEQKRDREGRVQHDTYYKM